MNEMLQIPFGDSTGLSVGQSVYAIGQSFIVITNSSFSYRKTAYLFSPLLLALQPSRFSSNLLHPLRKSFWPRPHPHSPHNFRSELIVLSLYRAYKNTNNDQQPTGLTRGMQSPGGGRFISDVIQVARRKCLSSRMCLTTQCSSRLTLRSIREIPVALCSIVKEKLSESTLHSSLLVVGKQHSQLRTSLFYIASQAVRRNDRILRNFPILCVRRLRRCTVCSTNRLGQERCDTAPRRG